MENGGRYKDRTCDPYDGGQVKNVNKVWRQLKGDAGLDAEVNPYSIRHTMAHWLRAQDVPAWEVAAQLGHKQKDVSTTKIYAPFDPAYLSNAVKVNRAGNPGGYLVGVMQR